jgi:hypothetical protein
VRLDVTQEALVDSRSVSNSAKRRVRLTCVVRVTVTVKSAQAVDES